MTYYQTSSLAKYCSYRGLSCLRSLFSWPVGSLDFWQEGSWVVSEAETREIVKRRSMLIYEMMRPVWVDTIIPMCEFCGKRRLEEMHHRKFRSQGGEWTPSNIIGLCWQCHKQATIAPAWAYSLGLSVSGNGSCAESPVCVWYNEGPVVLDDSGGYSVAG